MITKTGTGAVPPAIEVADGSIFVAYSGSGWARYEGTIVSLKPSAGKLSISQSRGPAKLDLAPALVDVVPEARGAIIGEPQKATTPELERLTWAEICSRYPDEWVVLIDTEWLDEDCFEFETAVVSGHGKGHDEVLRRTRPSREHIMDSGIFFTGRARPLPRSFPA